MFWQIFCRNAISEKGLWGFLCFQKSGAVVSENSLLVHPHSERMTSHFLKNIIFCSPTVLAESLPNVRGNCLAVLSQGTFFSVDFFQSLWFSLLQEAYWYEVKLSVHQHLSRWQSAFEQWCSVGEQSKVRIWLTVCSFIQSHLGMWTSFSAFPFDWAYRRLDVTCLKSYYSYYYKFLPLSPVEAWPVVVHYCVGCAVTHIDPFYMCSTSRRDVFDSNTFQ